nr:unnamed protein product [Callosobruchus chinensis]
MNCVSTSVKCIVPFKFVKTFPAFSASIAASYLCGWFILNSFTGRGQRHISFFVRKGRLTIYRTSLNRYPVSRSYRAAEDLLLTPQEDHLRLIPKSCFHYRNHERPFQAPPFLEDPAFDGHAIRSGTP